MERLIKGVSKEGWKELKTESIKHDMKMGEFLEQILQEHKTTEKRKSGWEFILNKKSSISNSEAEKVKEAISIFEVETEFE